MNSKWSRAAIVAVLFLFASHAQPTEAQNTANLPVTNAISAPLIPAPAAASSAPLPGHTVIVVHVVEESGAPLAQQAVVQLWPEGAPPVHAATQPPAQATFDGLQSHEYAIKVSAAGYETAENNLQTLQGDTYYQPIIKLKRHSAPADASAAPGHPLTPVAKKDEQLGMAAFEAGDFRGASAQFEKAFKLAPQDPELNFLLGVSLLKSRDFQNAQTFPQRATSPDPQDVPTLVALGRVRLQQGDYAGAIPPLKEATSIDPKHWGAHWLLGSVYLVRREFANAVQESERAIRLGKGAANGAQLVLGVALAALGEREQAQQALTSFVREQPQSPAAPVARGLILTLQTSAMIENKDVNKDVLVQAAQTSAKTVPVVTNAQGAVAMPMWRPPLVETSKPELADGITCPAAAVLDGAMQRVDELVANVNRFAATEQVVHENLNGTGKVVSTERRKFDYVVSIAQLRSGDLDVDESRNGTDNYDGFPADIATIGLPSLAFVFHKQYRSDFNFNCEGLGEWHGRAVWVVYFQQRPDRPSRIRGYNINGLLHPVSIKGRAWIAAGTFQVMRIEADLAKPLPEIKLRDDYEIIEYRPVLFEKSNTEMWLPATADLYFDFRNHKYHRVHSFSSYLLFSVTASQKIGTPKEMATKQALQ